MAKIYDKFGKPLGYSNATGLPSHQSKGLGDTVEKFTKATGVKSLVDFVTADVLKVKKGDCGCDKRKDKLNKMFPYGK